MSADKIRKGMYDTGPENKGEPSGDSTSDGAKGSKKDWRHATTDGNDHYTSMKMKQKGESLL